jgi:exoribonuclease R
MDEPVNPQSETNSAQLNNPEQKPKRKRRTKEEMIEFRKAMEQEQKPSKKRRPKLQILNDENAPEVSRFTIEMNTSLYRRILVFLNHYNTKVALPNNKRPKTLKEVTNSAFVVFLATWENQVLELPAPNYEEGEAIDNSEEE